MKRRGIGRGRPIIAAGAVIVAIGCFPPWWSLGGVVTPLLTGNAFDGIGAITFIAAVLLIALVVLPYATRTGEAGLDRPLSYVALATLAVGAYVLRVVDIVGFGGLGWPEEVPGLWLTAGGLAIVAWGVIELIGERPQRHWRG